MVSREENVVTGQNVHHDVWNLDYWHSDSRDYHPNEYVSILLLLHQINYFDRLPSSKRAVSQDDFNFVKNYPDYGSP